MNVSFFCTSEGCIYSEIFVRKLLRGSGKSFDNAEHYNILPISKFLNAGDNAPMGAFETFKGALEDIEKIRRR